MLCCAVLCRAVLCCAVLCCAMLCCAVLRNAWLCCTVLYCAVLRGAVARSAELHAEETQCVPAALSRLGSNDSAAEPTPGARPAQATVQGSVAAAGVLQQRHTQGTFLLCYLSLHACLHCSLVCACVLPRNTFVCSNLNASTSLCQAPCKCACNGASTVTEVNSNSGSTE